MQARDRARSEFRELAAHYPGFAGELETLIAAPRRVVLVHTRNAFAYGLVRLLGGLLPVMAAEERAALEELYANAGMEVPATRPVRIPHSSISRDAMVGHERWLGEVQLARYGVLYLSELTEFRQSVIESLASALRTQPGPLLVIASNPPCACGWSIDCHCSLELRSMVERSFARFAKLLEAEVVRVS